MKLLFSCCAIRLALNYNETWNRHRDGLVTNQIGSTAELVQMRPQFVMRTWVWTAAAGAVLAVCGVGSPRALAGCVHDGVRRSWQSDGASHFVWLVEAGAIVLPTGVTRSTTSDPPKTPQPCSGPACSRDSGLPSSPPVSTSSDRHTWPWLCCALSIVEPEGRPHPRDEARNVPLHRCTSIFHPPRGASE
jgi:hypothetical protein